MYWKLLRYHHCGRLTLYNETRSVQRIITFYNIILLYKNNIVVIIESLRVYIMI